MVKEASLLLQTSTLELSPVALFTLHISLFNHETSEMHLLLPLLWCTAVCWKGLREIFWNLFNFLGMNLWGSTANLVVCNWVFPARPPVWCLGGQGFALSWILTPGFLAATNLAFDHCQALSKRLFLWIGSIPETAVHLCWFCCEHRPKEVDSSCYP